MGKLKSFIIAAAALSCPFLACSGAAGQAMQTAAYFAAGITPENTQEPALTVSESAPEISPETDNVLSEESSAPTYEHIPAETSAPAETKETPETAEFTETAETSEPPAEDVRPITQNITEYTEPAADYTTHSGAVVREHYGNSLAEDHITLKSGAQVRNCTSLPNETLSAAAEELPPLDINIAEPTVLIVHTHTTECFQPSAEDWYDAARPTRTRDNTQNMVAVGNALADALAENGVIAVHDCTVHDYPAYSGAYDRSEDTIRAALEKYPSIKIVIDLHRDAIENPDGTRIAPVTEINGRNAAQFMIIAGCDDGRFNMPNYMENFRLACLIQNTAEDMYAGLARPVLFDYRNYNQHITNGSLLIEVGSHGNSLDEAVYTGELLGNVLAETVKKLCS